VPTLATMLTESVVGVTSRDYTHIFKNVGLCQLIFGTLLCALSEGRHFALVDSLPCQPNHWLTTAWLPSLKSGESLISPRS
jgi:hypothetical protein